MGKKEENPLLVRMKELGIFSSMYYNLEHHEKNGKHFVTACEHWHWNYDLGEGDSLDEALINLKKVINMYDKDFKSVRESIEQNFK